MDSFLDASLFCPTFWGQYTSETILTLIVALTFSSSFQRPGCVNETVNWLRMVDAPPEILLATIDAFTTFRPVPSAQISSLALPLNLSYDVNWRLIRGWDVGSRQKTRSNSFN